MYRGVIAAQLGGARAASSSAFRGGDSLSPVARRSAYGDKLSPPRSANAANQSLMQPWSGAEAA